MCLHLGHSTGADHIHQLLGQDDNRFHLHGFSLAGQAAQEEGREEEQQNGEMTVYEVTVIEFEDLRFVLVKCPHCAAQVRMDLAEEFKTDQDRGTFMFRKCPSCRKDLDSAVQPAINDLHAAYQRLKGIGSLIGFAVEGKGTKKGG